MIWKSIQINKQNVSRLSSYSSLIQMPHNSDFDGYSFWHTNKLIREGKHKNAFKISYSDDFTFNLVKYGKGKWNKKEIIDRINIGVEDFEEAFGVMDENIKSKGETGDKESYLIIKQPEKLNIENVEVKECLKNNN